MTEHIFAQNEPGPGVFSLTQIRHLMRVEFSRAQRYGYPVSCILIACDRLGHLRDLYGYEFREAVMDEIVELAQKVTRGCDYLGRMMDDRLMAILPHTEKDGALTTAERVLVAARGLDFRPEGNPIKVTLSVGLSHYENENTLFFDSLVEACEEGLRQSQEQGGDRFAYVAPGPEGS